MLNLKKLISGILCCAILLTFPLTAWASESIGNESDEYITFISGKERIESDGTFEFNVRSDLRSGSFTANEDTITIYSKCRRFNVNTGGVESTKAYEYTLTLYEKDTSDEVGSYTGYANNKKVTEEFSVKKGKEYYFIITCDPTHSMPYSLRGSGKVSDVTV